VPFRVAVTIESTPAADPPPVERSITASGDWTLTVPGGLVTVRMPQSAWPTPPTPQDYILILRVDARPVGGGFAQGTQIVDVTARWALAGTYVTQFDAPIEIVFSNPSGGATVPAHSPNGSTWTTIPPIGGPLPAWQPDGFTRSGSDVHVWTRHLTYFGLLRDAGAPTAPRDLAGVVADDGLTLRWAPGSDASGQMGNFILFVNGESYGEFGPTEFEAKLGSFIAGDTRTFTLAQFDAAGNLSARTPPLRAVPRLAGLGLAEAQAALHAAGFSVGSVTEAAVPAGAPGGIVAPNGVRLELAGTPIDLVVARGRAPQTRLAFTVGGFPRVVLGKSTTLAARINVSKPAQVTAVLRNAKQQRLYTWSLSAKAGSTAVKLRLQARLAWPGRYRLTWIARADGEVVSRSLPLTLVDRARATPKRTAGRVLLTGDSLTLGRAAARLRASTVADPRQAFEVLAARRGFSVAVVDADLHGIRFVADLRTAFPNVRVIAVSGDPARRTQARRYGALMALPRFVTAAQLAKAVARAAGR
jgi:hypothetical protein